MKHIKKPLRTEQEQREYNLRKMEQEIHDIEVKTGYYKPQSNDEPNIVKGE